MFPALCRQTSGFTLQWNFRYQILIKCTVIVKTGRINLIIYRCTTWTLSIISFFFLLLHTRYLFSTPSATQKPCLCIFIVVEFIREGLQMVCAMKLIGKEFSGKCIHVSHKFILLQLIISTLDTQVIVETVRHVWRCAETDFCESPNSLLFMCGMCLVRVSVVCMNTLHLLWLVQHHICLDVTAWLPFSPNLVQQPSFMYCKGTDI